MLLSKQLIRRTIINRVINPWIIVLSGSLLFFYDFTLMNAFNTISTDLMHDFKLTATQLGNLSSYYYYANLTFLFLTGVLLDRVSTRLALIIAMGVFVLCTLWFSLTSSITIMKLARFIMGICSTIGFLGSMRLATRWFEQKKQALVIGLIISLSMVGGMFAQTPMMALIESIGWRHVLILSSGIGIIFFCIMLLNVYDHPGPTNRIVICRMKLFIVAAVMNYKNWLLGLYASFMNLPLFIFGAMWGSIYLIQVHSLTKLQASEVSSMIFVGAMLGSASMGWLSDQLGTRKFLMLISSLLVLLSVMFCCYTTILPFSVLSILFFIIGFFTSAQILIFPLIAENNSTAITSSATSIASTLIMSGGAIQFFFGQLLDMHWNHWIIDHVPQYSVADYRRAIALIPITIILGMICLCIEQICSFNKIESSKYG